MFTWYWQSAECYVFMEDVTAKPLTELGETVQGRWKQGRDCNANVQAFLESRWFRRGWTLQELLAPSQVFFYDANNICLGTRVKLASLISQASGVALEWVQKPYLIYSVSVAERMSWASNRVTTREEDTAYALLGIFNVNMPLLYGEGDKAFLRLQEAIIRQSNDVSILAWRLDTLADSHSSVLARQPSDFSGSGNVKESMLPGVQVECILSHKINNKGLAITHRYVYPECNTTHRSIPLHCMNIPQAGNQGTLYLHLKRNPGSDLWYRVKVETRWENQQQSGDMSQRTNWSAFVIRWTWDNVILPLQSQCAQLYPVRKTTVWFNNTVFSNQSRVGPWDTRPQPFGVGESGNRGRNNMSCVISSMVAVCAMLREADHPLEIVLLLLPSFAGILWCSIERYW
ncbi:hypothetical protein LTR10_010101 [Elasticomyces elasticus]|nr:hypothetical protein LTR10_010101 [Elasticomyces elasticus]KAK4970391.1 hypothetical protein LTR42_008560 [Elasticomyces elasticus]